MQVRSGWSYNTQNTMPERTMFNTADFCNVDFRTVEVITHQRAKKLPLNYQGQFFCRYLLGYAW
jgi:hypothetical protein